MNGEMRLASLGWQRYHRPDEVRDARRAASAWGAE